MAALAGELPHRHELDDVPARPLAGAVDEADVITVQLPHRFVIRLPHADAEHACVRVCAFVATEGRGVGWCSGRECEEIVVLVALCVGVGVGIGDIVVVAVFALVFSSFRCGFWRLTMPAVLLALVWGEGQTRQGDKEREKRKEGNKLRHATIQHPQN